MLLFLSLFALTAFAANYNVKVGADSGANVFEPAVLTQALNPGDTITFNFNSGVHTVHIYEGTSIPTCTLPSEIIACSWGDQKTCDDAGAHVGQTDGTWVFTVPATVSSTPFFYQCIIHCPTMIGTGSIVNGDAIPAAYNEHPESETDQRNYGAHMLVSTIGLQRVDSKIDNTLEVAWTQVALNTHDAKKFASDADVLYTCEEGKCEVGLKLYFATDPALTSDEAANICDDLISYLQEVEYASGEWQCSVGPATGAKRVITESVATLTYTEDGISVSDNEANFLYAVVAMKDASSDLDDALEDQYVAWDLNTHGAKEVLDNIDTDYDCGSTCVMPFNVFFQVNTTLANNPLSDEDRDAICASLKTYYISLAKVTGDWNCGVRLVNDTQDDEYVAEVEYSQDGNGLSGGAIAAIVVCSFFGFVLLLAFAFFITRGSGGEDRV